MSTNFIIFIILLVIFILLAIIAFKKKWIGTASGGIYTGQVLMHDLANKDKQHAMEYVIENKEEIDQGQDESGEGPEGGAHKRE